MQLARLQTRGFRNLAPAVVDVDAPLVAFVGWNGAGKTNLLEAVGILGALRSFRTTRAQEVLRWGETSAVVEAVGRSAGMVRTWRWSFADGTRSLRRDDRPVEAVAWLDSLRATWFVPTDVGLVRGEPALRRALVDRALFNVTPGFLGPARDFKRVLDQKAALLRSGHADDVQLDILDEQLAATGAAVMRARARFVASMAAPFARAYADFAEEEGAAVAYAPWIVPAAGESEEAAILARVHRLREAERRQRRVLGGPQRDDLDFQLQGHAARAFASQGQARSLVLAWKLAELEVARQEGETPCFLLDDLGSELDPARTARLVDRVRGQGAQVFVTTTDPGFLPARADGALVYRVAEGCVTRL